MIANAINANLFNFLPQNASAKYIDAKGASLATGDTDLYTVPAGKKALFFGHSSFNASAGNISYYFQIKVSSVYYRITSVVTLATGVRTTLSGTTVIVLNAGESLSINTATTNGLNVLTRVVEFDATLNGIKTSRVLALSTGDNTIYTVPAGKTAILLGGLDMISSAQILVMNDSGGNRTYNAYVVPSGGAAGTSNKVEAANTVADNVFTTFTCFTTLNTGDFIVVNTDDGAATQTAWVNYAEI